MFSFQYRYTPSVWQYPKGVRKALSGVAGGEGASKKPSLPLGEGQGGGRIKLAAGYLEYKGEPDWHQQFDDPEQTMSLHRWNWLLYEEISLDSGLHLMRSWLSAMGAVPQGEGGMPYTTGERVVSALLFFTRHEVSAPDDIRSALLEMAYYVARHLEYHGPRATGNHVVNNARALFFAGQILGARELSVLALAVLKDAPPWLVTRDGFLREESSHYHLLFTRWLMEMHQLAKETHHNAMVEYLAPWIQKCAERCWFFLVQNQSKQTWQIPLIGDVSPDCTPEWLVRYLLPYLARYIPSPQPSPPQGGEGVLHFSPLPKGEGRVRVMQAFPESGWFRLDRGPVVIFWHVPQANMVHRATHGHSDLCSFVLFHEGAPVVIDPGRSTYTTGDPLYEYSGSAHAHNALTVDGFDPFLYDRAQKFPVWYQARNAAVEWNNKGDEFVFTIMHHGFYRIKGDSIYHVRQFRVSPTSCAIEDQLRGTRKHTIETFFHFAPGAKTIDLQNSTGVSKTIHGWTFPSYGVKIPSMSIVVSNKVQLPMKLNYYLQWNR